MVTVNALDKDRKVAIIFMDLSKVFDTLAHNLLPAKLNAHGFSFNVINLVQSYLSEQLVWINIKNNFGQWYKRLLGVAQGSIHRQWIYALSNLNKTLRKK